MDSRTLGTIIQGFTIKAVSVGLAAWAVSYGVTYLQGVFAPVNAALSGAGL